MFILVGATGFEPVTPRLEDARRQPRMVRDVGGSYTSSPARAGPLRDGCYRNRLQAPAALTPGRPFDRRRLTACQDSRSRVAQSAIVQRRERSERPLDRDLAGVHDRAPGGTARSCGHASHCGGRHATRAARTGTSSVPTLTCPSGLRKVLQGSPEVCVLRVTSTGTLRVWAADWRRPRGRGAEAWMIFTITTN